MNLDRAYETDSERSEDADDETFDFDFEELDGDPGLATDKAHSGWSDLAMLGPEVHATQGSDLDLSMALMGISEAAPDRMSDSFARFEHSSLAHVETISMNWEEI